MNFNTFVKSVIKESALTLITLTISLFVVVLYIFLRTNGNEEAGDQILKWVLFLGSLPIWYEIFSEIFHKNFGVDLIAGVALFSTFFFGQYLTGTIILIMLSGGEALESYALFRARRDLSSLLSRAPNTAHIIEEEKIRDIAVEEVKIGNQILIKPGEIVPVDGVVLEGKTFIDESTLTGESTPAMKAKGSLVFSGTINQNSTVRVNVTKEARDSSYAHIVKLVTEAEESRAPLVRLADRYSVYFTIITFIFAGGTWFLTHDSIRMLAVIVVATPCPLLLATPIALISGMSRIASHGVIMKNGGALENLALAKTFVFDKTGTVTLGTASVEQIFSYEESEEEVLRLAASLDQFSTHILATSIVKLSQEKNMKLLMPENFKEDFGDGVEGTFDGVKYIFGKFSYIKKFITEFPQNTLIAFEEFHQEGKSLIFLARENTLLGYIVLSDILREDSLRLFDGLRADGVKRLILLSGDKKKVAEQVGTKLNISEIYSECLPEDKLKIIETIPVRNRPVVMIGDGINDAPALAKAEVGIALGSRGKTATSDTADVVILNENIYSIRDIFQIARQTLFVAKQGILVGIGLSVCAMILGSTGFITPLAGAMIQEGIDVVVIINALRVSRIKVA